MAHLPDDKADALVQFMMSDPTSDETLMIDSLRGYLTAIAIGPTTPRPSMWLPGIWGRRVTMRRHSDQWSSPNAFSVC